MEIHAPHGPANTWKEFATHILIVTVGILIALGLEGIRETVHEHHQVRETRDLLREDLEVDRQHLALQRSALKGSMDQIDALLRDADQLNRNSGQISAAMAKISPGFYFFSATSWDTALSTGVLGHMSPEEVDHFAGLTLSVRNYTTYQDQAVARWYDAQAFFEAHPTLSPQELGEGRQKLILFRLYASSMNHLLDELADGLNAGEKVL